MTNVLEVVASVLGLPASQHVQPPSVCYQQLVCYPAALPVSPQFGPTLTKHNQTVYTPSTQTVYTPTTQTVYTPTTQTVYTPTTQTVYTPTTQTVYPQPTQGQYNHQVQTVSNKGIEVSGNYVVYPSNKPSSTVLEKQASAATSDIVTLTSKEATAALTGKDGTVTRTGKQGAYQPRWFEADGKLWIQTGPAQRFAITRPSAKAAAKPSPQQGSAGVVAVESQQDKEIPHISDFVLEVPTPIDSLLEPTSLPTLSYRPIPQVTGAFKPNAVSLASIVAEAVASPVPTMSVRPVRPAVAEQEHSIVNSEASLNSVEVSISGDSLYSLTVPSMDMYTLKAPELFGRKEANGHAASRRTKESISLQDFTVEDNAKSSIAVNSAVSMAENSFASVRANSAARVVENSSSSVKANAVSMAEDSFGSVRAHSAVSVVEDSFGSVRANSQGAATWSAAVLPPTPAVAVSVETYVATPPVSVETYVATPPVAMETYVATPPVAVETYLATPPVSVETYLATPSVSAPSFSLVSEPAVMVAPTESDSVLFAPDSVKLTHSLGNPISIGGLSSIPASVDGNLVLEFPASPNSLPKSPSSQLSSPAHPHSMKKN